MNFRSNRDGGLVWAFFVAVAATNALASPEIWMVWGMLLCWMGVMSGLGKKLPRLIGMALWVSMGTVLLGLAHFLMADMSGAENTKRNTVALLFIVYVLFAAPFLGQDNKKDSHEMFVLLAPLHTATQMVCLLMQEQYQGLGIGLVIQMAIYLMFIYQPSTTSRGHDQIWAGKIMLLSMALGGAIFLGRQVWDIRPDAPSIGDLPSVSISNKPVMAVVFPDLQPENTLYVEHKTSYVIPDMSGGWTSLPDLQDDHFRTERMGVGESMDFTMIGSSNVFLFMLPGQKAGSEIYQSTTGGKYSQTSQAWEQYYDKPQEEFPPVLEAMYLSIPKDPTNFTPKGGIDLDGAKMRAPATWAMVQEWKKQGGTDEQFIQKTLDYFRNNLAYHYDHQYMDEERNQLDWFLFSDKKGVCRHFSNAFALIMRMGGIKSRIRGGYTGGVASQIEGQSAFIMRRRDAHAWVEVWQDGKGWVLIDPTAVVPVEKGVPEDNSLLSGLFDGFEGGSFGGFKTAGSPDIGSTGKSSALSSMLDRVDPDQTRKTGSIIMALVGIVALVFVSLLAWSKYKSVPQQERQWRTLRNAVVSRGVPLLPSDGPRTVARKAAGLFDEQQRQGWFEAVEEYEKWKFGTKDGTDVVEKLRKHCKIVKQQPKSQLAIQENP